jgi:hypothetical protein
MPWPNVEVAVLDIFTAFAELPSESKVPGEVVPRPMFPDCVIRECIAVDDPTTNSGMPDASPFGFTESIGE